MTAQEMEDLTLEAARQKTLALMVAHLPVIEQAYARLQDRKLHPHDVEVIRLTLAYALGELRRERTRKE